MACDDSPVPTTSDPDALVTGEAVELDLRPTGWALRAAGALIDAVVYLGVYIAIVIALTTAAAQRPSRP